MSEQHVETVRRDVAARNTRDWSDLPEIWDPEIELDVIDAGTFHGVDGITGFFETISDLYTEYRVEVDEIVEVGDRVATVERIGGRGLKGSGTKTWVEDRLFRLITFRDGRIWRIKEYPSLADALEGGATSAEQGPG